MTATDERSAHPAEQEVIDQAKKIAWKHVLKNTLDSVPVDLIREYITTRLEDEAPSVAAGEIWEQLTNSGKTKVQKMRGAATAFVWSTILEQAPQEAWNLMAECRDAVTGLKEGEPDFKEIPSLPCHWAQTFDRMVAEVWSGVIASAPGCAIEELNRRMGNEIKQSVKAEDLIAAAEDAEGPSSINPDPEQPLRSRKRHSNRYA